MKRNKLILLVGLFALTGCNAVREVFDQGEFHTNEFLDNYYSHIPTKYRDGLYNETVLEISDKVLFSTPFARIDNMLLEDIKRGYLDVETAAKTFGDETVKNIKRSDYNSETSYFDALLTGLNHSRNVTWYEYAKYNSLSTTNFGNPKINDSFKRGVFSKLTDTLILCDGSGSLVRMQVAESGMGEQFDYELTRYNNLVFTARGGTNVDYAAIGETRVTRAKVRFNLSFYIEESSTKQKSKYTLSFVAPELHVDDNSITSVMKIDLATLFPNNELSRVNGMTLNYELLEHDFIKPLGGEVNEDYEFAMMLYEVMLPYSLWQ